ncbi:hypothetical protein BDW74DRAFT_172466 [Aspergillus multicolor]|uniref:uncharacterized protein n=1 Tax=Aspergillus multicolor TaxID=41759 RepID=UPI003CCD503F
MSGIEIGGIVLGAFPLVINALEHYNSGLHIVRLWETTNYEKEVGGILLEMEVQATIFRHTYLSLLRHVLDQQSVVKLLMEPNGIEKHSMSITPRLKTHLGPQWQMYSKLMEQLRNLLNTLRLHMQRVSSALHPHIYQLASLAPIIFEDTPNECQ